MLTLSDLDKVTLRETVHVNGEAFFGYIMTCVQHPRLQRFDKHWRKSRNTTYQYLVDGEEVSSLNEAVVRLNRWPVVTRELEAALNKITAEYVDHRHSIDYVLLRALAVRGLIEWDSGKCRRCYPANYVVEG